ncbi:hypothetical protein [Haliangium sp.]
MDLHACYKREHWLSTPAEDTQYLEGPSPDRAEDPSGAYSPAAS